MSIEQTGATPETVASEGPKPVDTVVYGGWGDYPTIVKSGEEAAALIAGMADSRLHHVQELLTRSQESLASGEYVMALKAADAVRWFMGEYMHTVARAVAASGTDPVDVLRKQDGHWITPHSNDYLPPFVPVPSGSDRRMAEEQRIARRPKSKQEAARMRLETKHAKERAAEERERERHATDVAIRSSLNLLHWPEYVALVKREFGSDESDK